MRRAGPGLVRTMGRTAVIAGTATVTSAAIGGAMQKRAMGKQAAAQEEAAEQQAEMQQMAEQAAQEQQAAQAPAAAPAGNENDTIAQLQQLAQLKQSGILTDEEFEAQKKKILGE
ncbi:MAG: SHOCT domain-containing protein [Chloroflexota bacterium]